MRIGDTIVALPSGKESHVKSIVTFEGDIERAEQGMAVTLTLEDEIDISRGDMIVRPHEKPESSKNYSLGAVLEMTPNVIFTADYWRIEQDGLVGLFSDQNEISLDYLLRLQGGSNPNVIRDTPDATTAAIFTSAGLDPSGAGEILSVNQRFANLDVRVSEGFDFGGQVEFDTDKWGDFKFKVNVANIRKFFQTPSAQGTQLLEAEAANTINSLVDVVGVSDLIKRNGNPSMRYTGSVRWRKDQWRPFFD